MNKNISKNNDISSLTLEELSVWLKNNGEASFRAKQIYAWLHVKHATSFAQMSNLPLALRNTLSENFIISSPKTVEINTASDGTQKLLMQLADGCYVETVLMHYSYGYSVCVSSQVGCNMACVFCASCKAGFQRNLTCGEMLMQVYEAQRLAGQRISHVVLMGIGEPLQNFDNVIKFLKMLSDENGINLSMRAISLSTCGIVPNIEKLAQLKLPITLSVSLHAATNQKRDKLMPVNKKWNIEQLLDVCEEYYKINKRRISYEYALFSGFNDGNEDAKALCELLKGKCAHVNLIRANKIPNSKLCASSPAATDNFTKILETNGITVTLRRRLGRDINAACGQLRANAIVEEKQE
jgi:23S rRNA (adenine2503-C2)-methyltransferase